MNEETFEDDKEDLEIQNLKYWSSYYANEAQRLESNLKRFGISKTDLSEKSNEFCNCLISIAQKLKLDKVDEDSYLEALSNLSKTKFENELLKGDLNNQFNEWNEKLVALNLIHDNLLKDYETLESKMPLEKQSVQNILNETNFMKAKLDKYKLESEKYKQHIDGIDPSLKHDEIIKKYEELKTLESNVHEMKKNIEMYHELPPNIAMAKLKLQEVKDKIKQVDKEIENAIDKDLVGNFYELFLQKPQK